MPAPVLILVVEDNATTRILLEQQIKALGHESQGAADIETACRLLAAGQTDLVLLDCHIDEASPADFGQLGVFDVPFVAMTATVDEEVDTICRALQITTVLKKPVTNAALRGLLDDDGSLSSGSENDPDYTVNASGEGLLRELVQLTDAHGVREIVASFLVNSDQRLAAIRQAVRAPDIERVRVISHAWKGVTGSFGAERLSRLLERLELAATGSDQLACARLLPDVEQEFSRVRRRLNRLVRELGLDDGQ